MKLTLNCTYNKLYKHFGPQYWWPGKTPFEVMVGAILTQNTNWGNVEKAIANLRRAKVLNARRMSACSGKRLAALIRPAGYYNLKAERLREFLRFFTGQYRGSIALMRQRPTAQLRQELLAVKGIGPETADSMLLYALGKPVFVIDAYTKRFLFRHRLIEQDAGYPEAQDLFMKNLKNKVQLFNEYHALLVRLGKDFCKKNDPRCGTCPLKK
jgi:endonuclease-3 related protein